MQNKDLNKNLFSMQNKDLNKNLFSIQNKFHTVINTYVLDFVNLPNPPQTTLKKKQKCQFSSA